MIIAVPSIIIMFLISASYSRYLLQLAPSAIIPDLSGKRLLYLFKIAVIAALIGIVLLIPFRIIPWDPAQAPVFVTLISIPMVFGNAWRVKNLNPINSKVNHKVFVVPIVILIALLLLFQLVLAKGVEM